MKELIKFLPDCEANEAQFPKRSNPRKYKVANKAKKRKRKLALKSKRKNR